MHLRFHADKTIFAPMNVAARLNALKESLPKGVQLIAVSKTHSAAEIMEAYEAGQRDFGENKVQEMSAKAAELPKDIRWHLIGHLQTNKVKYIAPFVHMIHSVDSLKLLAEIDKQAAKNNRQIRCLLQVFIASEETKFGLSADELRTLLNSSALEEFNHVSIEGLMGMASFTDDINQQKREFSNLKLLFEELKNLKVKGWVAKELSMGMSSDYLAAIECGASMIRVGSTIFGARNYS